MKHFRKHLLKTAVVVSALAIATIVLAQETKAEQKPTTGAEKMEKLKINPEVLEKVAKLCGDPAAQRIDFVITRAKEFVNGQLRLSPSKGRVQITGVIKNIGKGYYKVSNPEFRVMYLYAGSTELARKDFGDLAPGQEATITVERDWDSLSPNEGQFPPMYRLVIATGYLLVTPNSGPDVLSVDCNIKNNEIKRSGADINAMFKALR
jgi:hypothetical protein